MQKPRCLPVLAAVLGIAGALLGTASHAQQVGPPFFPQTLPSNTVVGRIQAGIGPASAIPFSQLGPLLNLSNLISVGTTPVAGGSSGQCLTINGGFVGSSNCSGGGGGSPGGTNGQVQFNNAGAFGGITGVTSNGVSLTGVMIALGSDNTGDIYYRSVSGNLTRLGIGSSNQALLVSGGLPAWATVSNSVTNSDGTLTISPTTGVVVASLALGHANTWTAAQTFNTSDLQLGGATSGTTTLNATAIASGTLTLPAATDQLIARATTDTLTNKTYDTAGTGNVFKINGTQITAISGNTATVASESGTLTSGNCIKSDANHNLVDAATTCGGGGGLTVGTTTVTGGAAGNLLYTDGSLLQATGGITWVGTGQQLNALGTITTNLKAINITGTWNNAATTFDAPILMNITNTASNSASSFVDIQSSGVSLFSLQQQFSGTELNRVIITTPTFSTLVANTLYFGTGGTGIGGTRYISLNGSGMSFGTASGLQFYYGNTDIGAATNSTAQLFGDGTSATNTGAIAIAQSTSPTTLRVYNTTDNTGNGVIPTNYERGVFDWTTTANVLTIGTQKGGTGSSRNIQFVSGGTAIADFGVTAGSIWTFNNSVSLVSGTNLVVDQTIIFNTVSGEDTGINRTAAKVLRFNDGTTNPNGWMQWAGEARVTADFSCNNSVGCTNGTTLTNVTGLSVSLQASRKYTFEIFVPMVTGGTAGGFKLALGGGATITNLIADGMCVDSTTNIAVTQVSTLTTLAANTNAGTTPKCTFWGTFEVNAAGTFTVQFAQNIANATNSTVKRGAYMMVNDIP